MGLIAVLRALFTALYFSISNTDLKELIAGLPVGQKKVESRVVLPGQAEIDRVLTNGSSVAAVELKLRVLAEEVRRLAQQLPKLHSYSPFKKLKLYGAVAGDIITPQAKSAADEEGFYILTEDKRGIKISIAKDSCLSRVK
jgi:hypothetical protein